FVADWEREHGKVEVPQRRPPTGKRVAIVGSGPSGLTVAGDLALLGHEVIVLEAYYDAMSVVPALAPGAEQACSIAGLLELARHLKAHPPARTVVFAATSAHFLNKRGIIDFLDRHSRREKYYASRMTDPIDIKLFISLDLSSHTDELGIWNSTTSETHRRFFAPFGRRFMAYSDSLSPRLGRDPSETLVNGISPIRGMSWSAFVPGGISSNSQVVLNSGLPALAFVTVNDARFIVDTPLDLPDRVKVTTLVRQVEFLKGLFSIALDDPNLFADLEDFSPVLKDNLRSLSGRVRTFPQRSVDPDRPVRGAVVTLRRAGKSHKGIRLTRYELADRKGNFYAAGLPLGKTLVEAYLLDPDSGEITYAPDLGEQAKCVYSRSMNIRSVDSQTVVVFPCAATDFYDLVDPRYLNKLSSISILGPKGTAPRHHGYSIGMGSLEPIGTIFSKPDEPVKVLMSAGVLGYRMLLINSQSDEDEYEARGEGFELSRHGHLVRTSLQAAKDMWRLDEARMRQLRRHGIENQRLSRLHRRSGELIALAERAEAERRWDDFVAHTRAALGVESRAYPDVLNTQNDVIKGIVFFLALVIPAAFFGERLLFAASDIRWQLGGFAFLLMVIWMLISQVHPAFKLAHPVVILLAFAIMAMAIFVLGLVLSRFNRYMKEYKSQMSLGVHDSDISRVSASYAAFTLGISNIRRRRLRTTLTLSTLILLTFTVLSFTSFKFSLRFTGFATDNKGTYEGALIRDRGWKALEPSKLRYTRSSFEHEALVSPRSWYMISETEKNFIKVKHGDRSAKALGVLGLTPHERE
ncbi:MAG: M28 family peptidase, partial [Candidatus Bathyarchaeia archaeon]